MKGEHGEVKGDHGSMKDPTKGDLRIHKYRRRAGGIECPQRCKANRLNQKPLIKTVNSMKGEVKIRKGGRRIWRIEVFQR